MTRLSLIVLALAFAASAAAQEAPPADAPAAAPAPADAKPADAKPADAKPADGKPAAKTSDKPSAKASAKAKAAKKKPKKRGPRRDWPVSRPAGAVTHLPPLVEQPYQPGERLKFEVRMFGAVAGEAILAVGERQQSGGRTLLPLVGFIRSSEFLDKFYPVDDRMVVVLDEKTFLPIKSDFYINEAKKASSYHTTYDHRSKVVRSVRKRGKGSLVREWVADAPIYEALGSVFGMRRMALQPGMRIDYYAWTGLRERWVQAEVVKVERLWTPMGWFDALRIEIKTTLTGGFIDDPAEMKGPAKTGTVWIGTDPARTPLKVVTPTRIGNAEAVLVNRYVEPVGKLSVGPAK